MEIGDTLYDTLRMVHVLAAALWFGGAVYQVSIIGPTLMQAREKATGFLATLARRGGIGRFFAISGGIAILAGGSIMGARLHNGNGAFSMDGGNLWITLGATFALLAYLHGLFANMPTERKWIRAMNSLKGAPTPEQAKELEGFGMKLGKNGAISAMIIGLAMLCMLLSRVLA